MQPWPFYTRLRAHLGVDWSGEVATTFKPVCVQGVIAAPRVRQRSQRDVHGVRLKDHHADVLFYDISVNTCCGNFRASSWLSLVGCCVGPRSWTSATRSMRSFPGTGGHARMSPGMRWYTAVGLHTMQFRTSCASWRTMTTAPRL